MTHLRKKLLILGTVACVFGAVQTASAAVQPAGTGEPLYTNSAQNTQWFEWPSNQRHRRRRDQGRQGGHPGRVLR